ncbi:hypothetical protein HK096_007857, partial [Nowakowskiella sp. JEL0078]
MGNKLSTFKTNRKLSKNNINLQHNDTEIYETKSNETAQANSQLSSNPTPPNTPPLPTTPNLNVQKYSLNYSTDSISSVSSASRSKRIGSIGGNQNNMKNSTTIRNINGNDMSAFGVSVPTSQSDVMIDKNSVLTEMMVHNDNAENLQGRHFSMGEEMSSLLMKRRYHGIDGSLYKLPSDIQEIDCRDIQHVAYQHAFEGLFNMPIHEILSQPECDVLDVGSGPGVWARDIAKKYPQAQIHAIDIVKTMNSEIEDLPNVNFVNANVLEPLPYPDDFFNAIFQRSLIGGIPKIKWNDEIKELFRITKIGGFVELIEFDKYRQLGPKGTMLIDAIFKVLDLRGLDIEI